MKAFETLKKMEKEFHENVNSHVFLLETNNTDECLKDIKELCKKLIATDDLITCTQIDNETYLELIVIRPEGKDIKKDQILKLQERLQTEPILSKYTIYIIVPADSLSEISANKLLKTIEEPNKHAIGFLITINSDIILPTIKSRCEILNLTYEQAQISTTIDEKCLQLATSLVEAIEDKDHLKYSKLKSKDKLIKENAKIIENFIKDYYNTACNLCKNDFLDQDIVQKIRKNYPYSTLVKKAKYLNSTLNKLTTTMNTDLLLEKIFLELKDVK